MAVLTQRGGVEADRREPLQLRARRADAVRPSARVQEEVYVVVAGSGRAKLEDEIIELGVWDVLRVAPQVIRSFEAGPDGMEMICVGGQRPEAATTSASTTSGSTSAAGHDGSGRWSIVDRSGSQAQLRGFERGRCFRGGLAAAGQ